MKQLMDLQNDLQQEKVAVERNGLKVVINGKMEVEEIVLNPGLPREEQAELIKNCLNEAVEKAQMAVAQRMSQLGGFGL